MLALALWSGQTASEPRLDLPFEAQLQGCVLEGRSDADRRATQTRLKRDLQLRFRQTSWLYEVHYELKRDGAPAAAGDLSFANLEEAEVEARLLCRQIRGLLASTNPQTSNKDMAPKADRTGGSRSDEGDDPHANKPKIPSLNGASPSNQATRGGPNGGLRPMKPRSTDLPEVDPAGVRKSSDSSSTPQSVDAIREAKKQSSQTSSESSQPAPTIELRSFPHTLYLALGLSLFEDHALAGGLITRSALSSSGGPFSSVALAIRLQASSHFFFGFRAEGSLRRYRAQVSGLRKQELRELKLGFEGSAGTSLQLDSGFAFEIALSVQSRFEVALSSESPLLFPIQWAGATGDLGLLFQPEGSALGVELHVSGGPLFWIREPRLGNGQNPSGWAAFSRFRVRYAGPSDWIFALQLRGALLRIAYQGWPRRNLPANERDYLRDVRRLDLSLQGEFQIGFRF